METQSPSHELLRILIVDDVKVNCRVLSAILEPYGACDVVYNGRDAVLAFQKAWTQDAPYHAICLDIMMPDIDGMKVLEVLRKMEAAMQVAPSQRVRAIVVSAVDDAAHRAKARQFECDGYLVKPIFRNDLVDCLKKTGLLRESVASTEARSTVEAGAPPEVQAGTEDQPKPETPARESE